MDLFLGHGLVARSMIQNRGHEDIAWAPIHIYITHEKQVIFSDPASPLHCVHFVVPSTCVRTNEFLYPFTEFN